MIYTKTKIFEKIGLLMLIVVFSSCCKNGDDTAEEEPIEIKKLAIYEEASEMNKYLWVPNGWMWSQQNSDVTEVISFEEEHSENPQSGNTCIKIQYFIDESTWAGIYWLPIDIDTLTWIGPGIDLYQNLAINDSSIVKLTFWVRGEVGNEKVNFKVGGITDSDDSIDPPLETNWITLTIQWQQYEIDLSNSDLSNIVGGFCWVSNKDNNPGKEKITFFLDNIILEVD